MASLKDIRIRIESTKNTQQITKAMKLVSAAKLRKAQHQIQNMRPYAQTLLNVIADIAVTQRVFHPLITTKNESKKILLVVVSSDRGLCGGFNSNINKFAETFIKENKDQYEQMDYIFVGRRASDYFSRKKVYGKETILKLDKDISYQLAAQVAEKLIKSYLDGQYDHLPEQAFYMVGSIEEAVEQAKKLN